MVLRRPFARPHLPVLLLALLAMAAYVAIPCQAQTPDVNATETDPIFENMVRTSWSPRPLFWNLQKSVYRFLPVHTDTKRVEEALLTLGDVRPKMVYATMTEQPPVAGTPLHMVLELLSQRHTTLGVLVGTYADDSIGELHTRPLPTLPGMRHVLQVDARHTTWGQGRNRLLKVAQETFHDFEYIALADDDVMATLRCCRALPSVPCATLLEEFRNATLRPMEVAAQQLCVSDFERHLGVVRPQFAGLFRTWLGNQPDVVAVMQRALDDDDSSYQRTNFPFTDAIFNVFSREAIEVDHIIPYDEEIESVSWWMSQAIVDLRLVCKYGLSDSVMSSATMAPYNSKHRPYPHGISPRIQQHPNYIQALQDLQDPVKCPMKLNAGRP
jgi:hypothetical protein